jgi:predicted DNA-binding transcriptional regulator YafY
VDYESSDGYNVIDRLMRLRDFLRDAPRDMESIFTRMETDYPATDSGKRRLRRDVRNLEMMGFRIERLTQPLRLALTDGPHILMEDDVDALAYIREMFETGHPLSSVINGMLTRFTAQLPDRQRTLWQRRPALRAHLTPAIDYSTCGDLLRWLETAIRDLTQISFLYRARGSSEEAQHNPLDPYDIEYTDRHFYLVAYSHQFRNVLQFRLDRIVQDTTRRSPTRLSTHQRLRQERRQIRFSYRLPASFADGGVSERFTTHAVRREGDFVIVEASEPSDFRIIRTLLGYGEHAVLLDGPPALMDKMRQAVMQMAANYGHGAA